MKRDQLSNGRSIYVLYSFDIYQTQKRTNTNIIRNGRNCTGDRFVFIKITFWYDLMKIKSYIAFVNIEFICLKS